MGSSVHSFPTSTGVSIYGFYGHLMTSRNIEIVLSNPIASQFRYLGYGATPSGLKAAGMVETIDSSASC